MPSHIPQLPNGSMHEALVDLEQVHTMKSLQQLVLDEWEQSGGKRSDGLMMEFTDAAGEWMAVTRSVTVETIKLAREIRLLPKRKSNKPSGSKGYDRVQQDERPARASGKKNATNSSRRSGRLQ